MKRLWKCVPPCMSDVMGMAEVIEQTEGIAVVDDSARYKPAKARRTAAAGGRGMGMETRGMDGRMMEGQPPRRDHGGRGGRPGGRGGRGGGSMRTVASNIRNDDIIHGTAGCLQTAYREAVQRFSPKFILFSHAPGSAMIGTDLGEIARQASEETGLPAADAQMAGEKDYLYGISLTLETMGKLLLEPAQTVPGTVNILGCNTLDMPTEALEALEQRLAAAGFQVLSRWGAKETTERLRSASGASVNLVVNVSGMRLARYMEREFGIPWVAGAPYGQSQLDALVKGLEEKTPVEPSAGGGDAPQVLVVGEQFMADALRRALLARGIGPVRVVSLFDADRELLQPGDARLLHEDSLLEQLDTDSLRLVLADGDYRIADQRGLRWIALPNPGSLAPVEAVENINMTGEALDRWLDEQLVQAGFEKGE